METANWESIFHRSVSTRSTHTRKGRETRTTTTHDHIRFHSPVFQCYRNHPSDYWRFLLEKCRACRRPGHIQRACQINQATSHRNMTKKSGKQQSSWARCWKWTLFSLKINAVGGFRDAILVHLNINGRILPMELDTGSAISVINKETYEENFADVNLTDTGINLRTHRTTGSVYGDRRLEWSKTELELVCCSKGMTPKVGRE